MELRDKLFTEEQYIKQLAKYYCRIEKLNSMIEQSEKEGDEISPDLYGRLFDCRVYTIVTMYSMGENLEFIKSNYISTINVLEKCWTPYGYYVQMLWLLSIGIMLEYDNNVIHKLRVLIDMKEVKDRVYDVLLNYCFPERKEMADCVFDGLIGQSWKCRIWLKQTRHRRQSDWKSISKGNGIVDIPIALGMTTTNMV